MSNKTIKNSFFSLVYQITTLFFALVIRKVFLIAFGVEYLGIINTFTSLIGALSLAELGFETSILYRLYQPLVDNDRELVSKIMNLFRSIYSKIAFIIAVIVILFSFFLKYIYKDVNFSIEIYIWYYLIGLDSVLSYLLAYKRTLLFADQKDYLAKRIDLLMIVLCNIARIVFLLYKKSVPLYICVQIFQTVGSNLFVAIVCRKNYPFIHKAQIDRELLKTIFSDVKNVFASKISYFVNTSTDVLVVSIMVGTTMVGYFTNYSTIITALKRLIVSILKPISPAIGNMLANKETENNEKRKFLEIYLLFCFFILMVTILPCFLLINMFIGKLYGNEFILPVFTVYLLCLNVFLVILQRGTGDYINGNGLFRVDKYIELIGALINLVFSVGFAIPFGLNGVLIGTIFSDMFFIMGRGIVVYRNCFDSKKSEIISFFIQNIYLICIFLISAVGLNLMPHVILSNLFILDFVFKGIIYVVCGIVISLIFTFFLPSFKDSLKLIRSVVKQRRYHDDKKFSW